MSVGAGAPIGCSVGPATISSRETTGTTKSQAGSGTTTSGARRATTSFFAEDEQGDEVNGGPGEDRCDIDPGVFVPVDDAKSCEEFFEADSAKTRARRTHFNSNVHITDITNGCKLRGCATGTGTVRSPKDACEPKRALRIFYKQPGPDHLSGKGKSGPHGDWEIEIFFVNPGEYYAKVKPKEIGSPGHKYTCQGALSPNHMYGP